jgi:hypothetical protein
MIDFEDDKPEKAPDKTASGKNTAKRFAAVRARGVLNAGMDMLAQEYEDAHKDMKTRWEYYAPTKDGGTDMVTMREGMGWKVIDWSEVPNRTASTTSTGPVRRGDLVLMCAPAYLVKEELEQDAEAARVELKSSETAFKTNLEGKKVTLSSGERDGAVGVGSIKTRVEEVIPRQTSDTEGG